MSDHTKTDYDWSDKLQDEGTWDRFKGKVREKWGEFTDDDLDEARGNAQQLIGKIKKQTGETADAIERWLRKTF